MSRLTDPQIERHAKRMNVQISGRPGSGKTQLRQLLLDHGYACSNETTNDGTVVRFCAIAPHAKGTDQ